MHINPYEQGNRYNVEPLRKRKLLLHGWQIEEMRKEQEQKSLTVVPLSLYFQRGFAKLEIALTRGKKLYDKRDSIAERDQDREARRLPFLARRGKSIFPQSFCSQAAVDQRPDGLCGFSRLLQFR